VGGHGGGRGKRGREEGSEEGEGRRVEIKSFCRRAAGGRRFAHLFLLSLLLSSLLTLSALSSHPTLATWTIPAKNRWNVIWALIEKQLAPVLLVGPNMETATGLT